MIDELENLRPEVHRAFSRLNQDTHLSPQSFMDWVVIRAELLRLAGELELMHHIQAFAATEAVAVIARAEKAEAELAALKARIFQGIILDVDDLARGHAGLPSEWRGKRVLLVVDNDD